MEKFSHQLLSVDKFLLRLMRFFIRAMGILLLGIIPGIIGFMITEGHSLSTAALNSGSQGVLFPPTSTAGKYFIALYGFFLQAVFLSLSAY